MIYKQIKSLDPKTDLILPFRSGKVDGKQLQELANVKNPDFDGAFSKIHTLYTQDKRKIYLLGLGGEKNASEINEAFRKLCFRKRKHFGSKIQLDCRNLTDSEITKAVLGFEMAAYEIGYFKSEKKATKNLSLQLFSDKKITAQIAEGKNTGETINSIKLLVDAPANIKTPKYLADWAQKSAKQYKYKCEVLDKKKLEKQGFGALLAVGKGSIHEPRLIQLSYLPLKKKGIDIALAGKGITFDSGGLSIKAAHNMHYMKSDMGGAAAVMGAIELVAKLKLKVNVVGVIAAAENAVDANSFRPGDVINSYSGKTIEIIDTDAEGRLVLADALNYLAKKFKPEQLFDLATLTGSVVRTLGFSAAGMFTNNKEIAERLSATGNLIHERVWHLPLFDDFEEDLHSDVADIRNFSGKPIAGGITAAKFLEAFTDSHKKWMHLDMAGMAFGSSEYAKMKSASGFGVRLITEYIKSLEKN